MNSQVQEKILEQLSGIIETAGFEAVNDEKTEYKNEKIAFKIGLNRRRHFHFKGDFRAAANRPLVSDYCTDGYFQLVLFPA